MQYAAIGTYQTIAPCRTTRASMFGRFTSAAARASAASAHHIHVSASGGGVEVVVGVYGEGGAGVVGGVEGGVACGEICQRSFACTTFFVI